MAFRAMHPNNLVYIGICVACLAAFAVVGIIPNTRQMAQLEADIEVLNAQAKTQEILFPVFKELLREAQQSVPEQLLLPDKDTSANVDLGSINAVFSRIAAENRVDFRSATPDASSYLEEGGALTMNVSFSGDFFAFRNLLLSICRLPYLASIDRVRVETVSDRKVIALQLRLSQQ